MSQAAIIGVVVLMMMSSSVGAVALMMGGDDKKTGPTGPTGPAPPSGPPKGRYVKLEHTVAYDADATGNVDDKNRIINLAELEVFDASGTNLAASKTVTGSSEYPPPHVWSNLTDGNKTNFAHTLGRTPSEYDSMTVDLGAEKEIKKLVITNRTSCCKNRAVGVKAVILAADGTTVVKETPAITTTADTYTLTFPGNTWS
jgi:hypothetical protein